MSNTILSSKNTFEGGLVMDFSPSNSRSNTLSSALNATFITLNGNELQLQNDMGNGRVETARLPEGYIPVGTCEFGDIIYIVSYNPLTNKSQIGCFPSPERNISSKEISDIEQVLSYTDFQEIDKDENLTGSLKNTTVKKVLIETKKLNPGDKYIVYTDDPNNIIENANFLSDWGKGEHGIDPKYLKLHIVSIEDQGKITYLDTTTKWYDIENTIGSFQDYYISAIKNNATGEAEDLDSYRNNIESNWSIFNSKVSGKLAILAELESIDSFSCSYELELSGITSSVQNDGHTREYKQYKLYLYPEHTSKHSNIKPSSICASKSSFTPDPCKVSYAGYKLDNNEITTESKIEDAIFEDKLDNVFTESLGSGWAYSTGRIDTGIIFKIPHKDIINNEEFKISSESFVYSLEIIPCMEYGRLDQFKQTITIDFNKIGSGEVELSTWKYHNTEEQSVLTFGVNYYPQPQHEIKAIIIDFYDNQGICTEYRLQDRKSYNGTFTEYLQLGTLYENVNNSKFYSSKLQDYQTSEKISELQANNIQHYTDASFSDGTWSGGTTSDVNVIYPNFLYGVKIRVLTAREGATEDSKQEHVFYRWFWTTTMYNDYYYQYDDFDILGFNLELTGEILFASKNNFNWIEQTINNLTYSEDKTKSYSTNVYTIGEDNQSNLKMSIHAGLTNNYGCFNLYHRPEITDGVYKALNGNNTVIWLTVKDGKISEGDNSYTIEEFKNIHNNYTYSFDNPLSIVDVDIYLGDGKITYDNNDYLWSEYEEDVTQLNFIKKEDIEINAGNEFNDITDLSTKTLGLLDTCDLKFTDIEMPQISPDGYSYYIKHSSLLNCIYSSIEQNSYIDLTFKAQLFSKAYIESQYNKLITDPIYQPIVNKFQDLESLGIGYYQDDKYTHPYFLQGVISGDFVTYSADATMRRYLSMIPLQFTIDNINPYPYTKTVIMDDGDNYKEVDFYSKIVREDIKTLWEKCIPEGLFFLLYPAPLNYGNFAGEETNFHMDASENITHWSNSFWEDGYEASDTHFSSALTQNTVIVKDNEYKTYKNSLAPFLAVKTGDSFTVLNSAYISYFNPENDKLITQYATHNGKKDRDEAHSVMPYPDALASQLCLLLTHVYTDKCMDTETSSYVMPNIISNCDTKTTLSKNVLIKFIPNNDIIHSILFHGMDFNYYVYLVQKQLQFCLDYHNTNCNFIESAIQSNIVIEKNTKALVSNSETKSYYKTADGKIFPLYDDLEPDTFYILQGNNLEKYEDHRLYYFPIQTSFLGRLPLHLRPFGRDSEKTAQHMQILEEYCKQLPNIILQCADKSNYESVLQNYLTNTNFEEDFKDDKVIFPLDTLHASTYKTYILQKPIYHPELNYNYVCIDTVRGYMEFEGIYFYNFIKSFDLEGNFYYQIPYGRYAITTSGWNLKDSTNSEMIIEPAKNSTNTVFTFKIVADTCILLDDIKITILTSIEHRIGSSVYNTEFIIEQGIIQSQSFYYDPTTTYHTSYTTNNFQYTTNLDQKYQYCLYSFPENPESNLNTIIEYTHNIIKCGLGLNKWFYYDDNNLKTSNTPFGEEFGYLKDNAIYPIYVGIKNYYVDEDFRIDSKTMEQWVFHRLPKK